MQVVKTAPDWAIIIGLIAMVPLTVLFFGLEIPQIGSAPTPYMPNEASAPIILMLVCLPWMLAAGFVGGISAVGVGLLSGLLIGLFYTHHIVTVLEMGVLAMGFSALIQQSYRTAIFNWLRHPVVAAVALGGLFVFLHTFGIFIMTKGSAEVRLDYALTYGWAGILTRIIELIVAGGLAEILYLMKVKRWTRVRNLIPSPSEYSIQKRYYYTIVGLVLIIAIVMVIGQWVAAGKAAEKMVNDRLDTASNVAIQTLPYFFETGQTLLQNMADPELFAQSPDGMTQILAEKLRLAPFFRELYVFDRIGQPVTGYPVAVYEQIRSNDDTESLAINKAINGYPYQVVTLPPWANNETAAQISFISAIKSIDGQVIGVLVGRTDIVTNPFTLQAVQALTTATQDGGVGMILDEDNRILYHTAVTSGMILSTYDGKMAEQDILFDDLSPAGTRQLTFYRKASGRPWSVVLSVPAQQTQRLALNLSIPLLSILGLALVLGLIALRFSLKGVSLSLERLAKQTTEMAGGKLDKPVYISGVDEVGRLSAAFEKMRVSLRSRLEELNRLLKVTQGVAANLDVERAIQPVMEAALDEYTHCVRVVLASDVTLDNRSEKWVAFGVGKGADFYTYLDGQLFELMQNQDVLPIPNMTRIRRLQLPNGAPQPGALISLPVRHENAYYGALWIGYERPHTFTEEEIRFFTTLAGEVSMAAANSQLYTTAEIGRQRLEAVLSSTPDPVLVFDSDEKLFLLNPAALQVVGLVQTSIPGSSVEQVVAPEDLVELINTPSENSILTREVTLGMGRIYYASVSPVVLQDDPEEIQHFGKICLLRDITHFKELDSMKSDFVATVSHDLRSPLTLMRGYSTMLQMVGELNEQQKSYLQKMVAGVDNMSRLVNNLLDLGRIEAGIDLKPESVNPNEVIEQVISNLQLQATQKTIQLINDSPAKRSANIQADPALLHQAIYNLVENAIKYSPVNGIVKIRCNSKNEKILFEVQDNGIGVAPLDLPRVFEKFYRSGRREAYQQKGTGLGLAIVKSVAERHHGRVWVESQLGKGSTFFIELPVKHHTEQK